MIVKIKGRNISVLHGELMGIIMAHIAAADDKVTSKLYSDLLNAVRMVNDNRSMDLSNKLRNMNGRSYYRWIFDLQGRNPMEIQHIKAHTNEQGTPALLNTHADLLASRAQTIIKLIPEAPEPTFFLDDYTFYRENDRWIESNIRTFIDYFLAQETYQKLSIGNNYRMACWLYNPINPPEYSYLKAQSAYSAVVQLYARSGQLATMEVLNKRGHALTERCRYECDDTEDQHHIFVICPKFGKWRSEAMLEIVEQTKKKLVEAKVDEGEHGPILKIAKHLFLDSREIWPLQESAYYLGHIPELNDELLRTSVPNQITRTRISYGISANWHLASIRLASRIFGQIQRDAARKNELYKRNRDHFTQRLMACVPSDTLQN
jgi:hypothetical protein